MNSALIWHPLEWVPFLKLKKYEEARSTILIHHFQPFHQQWIIFINGFPKIQSMLFKLLYRRRILTENAVVLELECNVWTPCYPLTGAYFKFNTLSRSCLMLTAIVMVLSRSFMLMSQCHTPLKQEQGKRWPQFSSSHMSSAQTPQTVDRKTLRNLD